MTDDSAGQATNAPAPEPTSGGAPTGEGNGSQSTGEGNPNDPSTGTGTTDDSFFDPTQVPDELKPAYKQMQAAFTKKTQAIKDQAKKIEAYDTFARDPVGAIQQLAASYGLNVTREQAAAAAAQATNDDSGPQTWEDVYKEATQRAEKNLLERLGPIIKEVQETKKTQIERMLDESCPDWRQYEDDMRDLVQKHPTLVNDPVRLYRLAVPPEVLESRATQAALKKMQTKAEHNQVSGGSTTTKIPNSVPKAKSFEEAVRIARANLAAQGITER